MEPTHKEIPISGLIKVSCKNLYKFIYFGQLDEDELTEQDLKILEEITEYGKNIREL